ncbi:glutathione S-transferase [Mycena rosella]|uniref:glutathione transferase n=1 Tax=Mycena rosella TaxID=1033263 RepID=A0AAD7G4S0_MYCRO|nr:glutathione S-transferase [Mycena rosella]
MVLKLYSGARAGGGSGIVALVLAEKQIPFEHVFVDMANGAHKSPEFLAKHPFGQIPVIDDDGFILYESRAICRYLAEKYADQGTPLLPTRLEDKALFEQAASVEFANFHPQVLKVMNESFSKKRQGLPVDEAALAQIVSELSAKLDVYEVILGKQKFLAGNELTLADLFHLSSAPFLAGGGVDIMTSKGPNVTRWWNELIQRPAWIKLREEGITGTAS